MFAVLVASLFIQSANGKFAALGLLQTCHILEDDLREINSSKSQALYTDELVRLIHVAMGMQKTVQSFILNVSNGINGTLEDKVVAKSAERAEGHIIITWDISAFQYPHIAEIIPNPRGTYILFLMNPNACHESVEYINILLWNLWIIHDVMNFIIMHPCSCDPRSVYNLDPFKYNYAKLSWGTFNKVGLEEFKLPASARNLGGIPLNVSMFTRIPTALRSLPDSMSHYDCQYLELTYGFRGPDGCVLANMAHYLNFTIVFVGPTDISNYGYKLKNGSFIGSLGDVVYKKAHISANSRFVNVFGADYTEYTTPVNNDLVCFIVRKAKKVPKWMIFFNCYTLRTWSILISVMVLCAILWSLMRNIKFSTRTNSRISQISVIYIFGIFFNIPLPRLPHRDHLRILLAACMIFNVIIVGIFQGTLFKSFSSIAYYPDINTLQQLYESNLPIATSLEIFQENDIDIMQKLQRHFIFLESKALNRLASHGDVAAVERSKDAHFYIQTRFMNQDGVPLLHIVKECPATYYLSYIVPKHSPFLPLFNEIITRLIEAGLTNKWYHDVVEGFIIQQKFSTPQHQELFKSFNLGDVQAAFYFYSVGLVMASFAFATEKMVEYYSFHRS